MCEPAYHIPVLLDESVNGLNIKPSGIYVDVTFGGGGHSKEILSRLNGKGRLFSFDQDADAEKNIEASEGFTFVRSNFRYLKNWMRYYGVEKIDGLLADLGVSSHHFDDESRGFSFRFDAPLDMRMNKRAGKTAADVVNEYDEERLADIFFLYGEMKNSRKIASMLVRARQNKPIQTTLDLITAVRGQQTPTNTMAESREKKLDKIEVMDKPTETVSDMRLKLEPVCESGNDVLYVEGLSKAYGTNQLFENLEIDIKA